MILIRVSLVYWKQINLLSNLDESSKEFYPEDISKFQSKVLKFIKIR